MQRNRRNPAAAASSAHAPHADASLSPPSSPSSSSSPSPSRTPSPSPFDLVSHWKELFSPQGRAAALSSSPSPSPSSSSSVPLSPSPSPSPLLYPCLDGLRALLCVWMICLHSLFYTNSFLPDAQHEALVSLPLFSLINLGFLPVDGFFVLTGFLIAMPLFQQERRVGQAIKDSAASPSSSSSLDALRSLSLRDIYFRRFSRLLPLYFFSLILHCLLFPVNHYSLDVIRSEGMRWFLNDVTPEQGGSGSGCNALTLASNVLQLNNQFPFGGCMGWTWSFAVQVQFYLFFPLAWKLLNKNIGEQQFRENKGLASQRMMGLCCVGILLSLLIRLVGFIHLRTLPLEHTVGVMMGFLWYANTATRTHSLLAGCVIAYITTHKPGIIERLKRSPVIRMVCWLVCVFVLLLQLSWNRVFAEGKQYEVPGFTAVRLTQHIQPFDDWVSVIRHAPHHVAYYVFAIVGSPGTSFLFGWLLLASIHSIGAVGSLLNRFLSLRFFYPLSALSVFAYFFHPFIIFAWYAYYTKHHPEWRGYLANFLFLVSVVYFLTFSLSLICHLIIEKPLDIILRRRGEKVGAVRRGIFIYCCILIAASVVAHPLVLWVYTRITPPEGIRTTEWKQPVVKIPLPADF